MKTIIIILSMFLNIGCASMLASNQLTLNKVLNLKIDKSSDAEISEKFGQPNEKRGRPSEVEWIYNDPKTGYQRLALTFSDKHTLNSILWIPKTGETEKVLRFVQERFPNLKAQPIDENTINPHSPIGDVTYRDDASGQVILVNEARATVTAIAWYSPTMRDAAGTTESKKLRYSIEK